MATSTVDRQEPKEQQPMILRIASDAWSWSKIPVMEVVETVSSSYVGQMVLKFADKFLWVIEKSSQWALPPPQAPANDKMVVTELTRPLPWLLFLPTLFWLRILREMMSFCALMMGMEPIRPSSIVRFIQNSRKTLRTIKYNGIRNLRTKNAIKSEERVGIESWFYWIIIKIQSMLCYNAVVYEHAPHKNLTMRKNSGEKIVVSLKKKSPSKEIVIENQHHQEPEHRHENDVNVEDFDASIFKKLVQDLEEFINSDDDDFSVGDDAEDTSVTSVDDEDEGYYQPEDDQYKNNQHHQNKIEKAKSSEIPVQKPDEVPKKTEILKIVENGNQKEGSLTNGSTELKNLNVTDKTLLNNEAAAGSSSLQEPKENNEKAVEEKNSNSFPATKKLNRDRKNRFNPRVSRKGVATSSKQKNGQSVSTVEKTVVKSSVEASVVEQSKITSTVKTAPENTGTSPPATGQSSEKISGIKQPLNKSLTMEQSGKNPAESPKKTSTPEANKSEKQKEIPPQLEKKQNDAIHSTSEIQKSNAKSPNKENLDQSAEKQKLNSDGNKKPDSGYVHAISKDVR